MSTPRKIVSLFISLLLIVIFPTGLLASSLTYLEKYQGTGTLKDPYLIYSEEDLRKVGNDPEWTLNKNYKLMVDIVLEKPEEGQSNWVPIGDDSNPFRGNFEGNNKTIKNITIVDYESRYLGFFGRIITQNSINDLGLLDINIKGSVTATIGGLSGSAIVNSIRNCYTTGNIQTNSDNSTSVGGIVGIMLGIVENCYSNVNIYGGEYSGGIVGTTLQCEIRNSYSTGSIYGYYSGGIVGLTYNETIIENCYSISTIKSIPSSGIGSFLGISGGIVGYGKNVFVKNCYFSGTLIVAIGYASGGIVATGDNSTIRNCVVTCNTEIIEPHDPLFSSPIIGYIIYPYSYGKITFENNYILEDIYWKFKNRLNEANYISVANVCYVSELTKQSFYELLGWDFSSENAIWEFTGDYMLPKLVEVGGQENLVTPNHLL